MPVSKSSPGPLVAALLGTVSEDSVTGSLVAALLGMTVWRLLAQSACKYAVIPSDSEGSRGRQAYEPVGKSSPGPLLGIRTQ